MTTATIPMAEPDERLKATSTLHKILARPELGSLFGAILVFALFWIVAPSMHGAAQISTILYGASTLGIMAVGVALLMIGGEFDLSAGVAVTSSAMAASLFAYQLSLNVWVGVVFALAVSLVIGFWNGYLVVRTGIPSFLISLGSFLMLFGLNIAVTRGLTGNVASPRISDMDGFATAQSVFAFKLTVFGVQLWGTVVFWVVLVAIATWILLRTKVGNWIYAVGGDAESARAVGVPVNATKIGLFMGVGFCAWLSGMHLLFRFSTVQSGEGYGNEFLFIICAVVGGCMLTGGYGTAIGAAIGAFILGLTTNGIVYAGWENNLRFTFLGAMLLFATLANLWVRKRTEKR